MNCQELINVVPRISASKLYRFLIGPEKREFNIHAAIITQMSPVLAVFVNGTEFKEAREGQAELKDVDEKMFTLFVEYAYTGDYKPSFPSSQDLDSDSELVRSYKRRRTSQDKWRNEDASGRHYWQTFDAIVESYRPRSYTEALKKVPAVWTADFPNILLDHARLHIFADCYQIASLMRMSLFHLGRELQKANEQPAQKVSVEAIVSLLEFSYAEPRPRELRSLVAKYTTCSVERLYKDAGFKKLLNSHVELGADLVQEMVARFKK